MQAHPQTASAANADQRLSQLIKLKQLEKPDAAYWQNFEQEFRSRQLTTFVQIQPMHTRLRRACMIIARKAAPPVAAAGAVALTFFAVSNTSYLAKSPATETQPQAAPFSPTLESQEQDVYFIVETDPSSGTISSDTIYQINALNSKASGYQLNATPVTFSQNSIGQTNGANILTKQPKH